MFGVLCCFPFKCNYFYMRNFGFFIFIFVFAFFVFFFVFSIIQKVIGAGREGEGTTAATQQEICGV